MSDHEYHDIYARISRNRRRLTLAIAILTVTVMALSAGAIYLLREAFDIAIDFWLLCILFWLLFLLYALLRYALGGRWLLKGVKTLPAWKVDYRLEGTLEAATLASGMVDRVRLFEIPHDDINAYSLSLPDGSFAIFLTRGIASKLPERERVAIVSHEIAHMQAGDATIYTVMIRMAGRRSLKKLVGGMPGTRFGFIKSTAAIPLVALFVAILFVEFFGTANEPGLDLSINTSFWIVLVVFFIVLLALLPPTAHLLLKVVLDRDREYHADMHAVYLNRDPEAIYQAIRLAAEDVRDVIILPACFDALLFCPVVDYSSYKPYRTQPTMAQRMSRLQEAFPIITA